MSTLLPEARRDDLVARLNAWFLDAARPLPWRSPDTTPWGIFLSEVMSQQTPVARVAPIWQEWLERWPTPSDLAAAAPGEAVRHWGRLGYPRRALRLHDAAVTMVERHGGEVPSTHDELLALPGVGEYTAAAVASFAFGERVTVIDTNIRRVEARTVTGVEFPRPNLSAAERRLAALLLPQDDHVLWNAASMEFGAVVCTAKAPACGTCPIIDACAWQLAGAPVYDGPARRGQAWAGTDRMVRGKLLAVLREAHGPVERARLDEAWDDDAQRERCLSSLITDGLVDSIDDELFALPGHR